MTLYDRLPDLIEGCNELVRTTGVRRRITVCDCWRPDRAHLQRDAGSHFIASRVDRIPAEAMR